MMQMTNMKDSEAAQTPSSSPYSGGEFLLCFLVFRCLDEVGYQQDVGHE